MNANRSQSTCERVSVRGDKICRERVCASQRPGGVLASRFVLSRRRDGNRRSGLRECRGKPGVLSETAGDRICAGLGGGGGSPDRTGLRQLFPANREKNRELRENRPSSSKIDVIFGAPSMTCEQIPYVSEQGIFSAEQGMVATEQGSGANEQRIANCRGARADHLRLQ
jgi:hypothetical protein